VSASQRGRWEAQGRGLIVPSLVWVLLMRFGEADLYQRS
jgi:hypothetical protein